MKRNIHINSIVFNKLYYLFIKSLVGKLIKKGKNVGLFIFIKG